MAAVPSIPIEEPADEQRMLLYVSWKEYVLMRDLLDGPGLRMTYSKGALELMSPSPEHELWKKNIARFVEHFAFVRDIALHGYGQTTFKKEAKERGAEPDECYLIGKKLADYPEIVLEVIHTNPLIDKLDIYLAFGVAEVWVFRDGAFTLYAIDTEARRYVQRSESALVPGLDFTMLARFAVREDTPQALREFDTLIRRG
jgi:Uma2 family endonuclease